ncbi:hypothetical protein HAX54_021477 [Datura stramonium]|uniref:Uncharacterized protein n=1 Tax=Datura stramonium TaxID=4076 RepID=A0ABS8UUS0_DATST|nr:hypothetical protein [Datura stramonium]
MGRVNAIVLSWSMNSAANNLLSNMVYASNACGVKALVGQTKGQTVKQKRNIRKIKDKERDEKPDVVKQDKINLDGPIGEGNEYMAEVPGQLLGKPDILEETAESIDCVIHPDSEDRDESPFNWDTDTSEVHPSVEAGCSGLIGLSASQHG